MKTAGHKFRFVLLMAGSFALFTFGSWHLPLLGPDEPRYSQIARQMLESGNYVVPYLGSLPWFEKPVLLYWLMSACYFVFGINEFAARLPSALAALGSVLIIYATVSRVADPKRGFVCALILATSACFVGFSHAATFDMLLTFFITAALCSFAFYQLDTTKRHFLYLMYVATGMAILAKGLVGLILVGLPLFFYLASQRRWTDILAMKPLQGLLIIIVVACVWFLPISIVYDGRFWDEFVYQHHFVRYLSDHFHRTGSILFYVPILLLGAYPWSMTPFLRLKIPASARERGLILLAGSWLITTIGFFTFSQSKLPGYILPTAPAFAIISGMALLEYLERERSYRRMVFLFVWFYALVSVALIWMSKQFPLSGTVVYGLCVGVVALTSLCLFLAARKKFALAVLGYVLTLIAVMATLFYFAPPTGLTDSRDLCFQLKHQLRGNDKLLLYNLYDFSPLFYLNGRVELTPEGYLYDISDYRELHRYLSRTGHAFVMVSNTELPWIESATFWRVKKIARAERISVVELHSVPTISE